MVKIEEFGKLKNACLFVLVILICIVFLNSFVSAFAVGTSGDLSLYPGQTLDIAYDIMNTIGGSSNIILEGKFLEGSEIASFSAGNRFSVSEGSVVPAPIRYRIPANAPIGTVYNVKVIFKTVSEGEGSGSVSFVEDSVATLKVTVVEQSAASVQPGEEPKSIAAERASVFSSVWFWILIIIVIIIILWLVTKAKKK